MRRHFGLIENTGRLHCAVLALDFSLFALFLCWFIAGNVLSLIGKHFVCRLVSDCACSFTYEHTPSIVCARV